MVPSVWKINQRIFHEMFYNNCDEEVANLVEYDYYSVIINCLRYFQFDDVELSYPSKQFCVRYIYACFLQKEFGENCEAIFNDSTLLYNNAGTWYDDTWNIFDFLVDHIGNPLSYYTRGVSKTISYARQEFLLEVIDDWC